MCEQKEERRRKENLHEDKCVKQSVKPYTNYI